MTDKLYQYSKPEYEGFETDYRILDALDELSNSSILNDDGTTNESSAAYIWWTNGGDEDQIINYIDENYPDWTCDAPLYWGAGGINEDKTLY